MSDFLDNLKKAADEGEFNSDAAKKILEISELADKKISGNNVVEDLEKIKEGLEKRIKNSEETKVNTAVTEEEALELNSEYEKKMEAIKKQDLINSQIATLIEIEDMVKATVMDMFDFISEIESMFEKEFKTKDLVIGDLTRKIEEFKSKYKTIIN